MTTFEELVQECIKFLDTYIDYPYGDDVTVIRNIKNKSFALIGYCDESMIKMYPDNKLDKTDIFITLKYYPDLINQIRSEYLNVVPGYYSNKNHWNTIILNKDVPFNEIITLIKVSYQLVTPKSLW
jgi:predicted DNA-binding protein (MmcQ/YjbR family)